MSDRDALQLFEGFGVEIEYMIVDSQTLCVRPIADELLRKVGGGYEMEVELGDIAWSNELALHVIELKCNGPARTLDGLEQQFQDHVVQAQALLEPFEASLMPTAMHPWMDPQRELRLWPHEKDIIYRTFDRVFDCRGHGWANLQSAHLNLPFADDKEFGRLHAAVRLVLPILPALAASSPIADGRTTGFLDTRLEFYRRHMERVPSAVGDVIPEPVFSRRDYERGLLRRIYADLAPVDPDGVLRHEWVNARGCIARFDRMALEIRLLDVQECPAADLAIAAAVTAAVRGLVEETWCSSRRQQDWDHRELAAILLDGIAVADQAVIDNRRFLDAFGYPDRGRARAQDLWQHLIEDVLAREPGFERWRNALEVILSKGCLARRIVAALGEEWEREKLHTVYRRLADCLRRGVSFDPG